MGDHTPIGRLTKFPKEEVARFGYDRLMAGDVMVVGGGDDLHAALESNRTTPEPVKARHTPRSSARTDHAPQTAA